MLFRFLSIHHVLCAHNKHGIVALPPVICLLVSGTTGPVCVRVCVWVFVLVLFYCLFSNGSVFQPTCLINISLRIHGACESICVCESVCVWSVCVCVCKFELGCASPSHKSVRQPRKLPALLWCCTVSHSVFYERWLSKHQSLLTLTCVCVWEFLCSCERVCVCAHTSTWECWHVCVQIAFDSLQSV